MKKLLAVLVIVFAATAAWAQPTFSFTSGTPCAGDTFCVDVTVKDFTDISKVKFPVYWDTAVLQFVGTRNYGLEKLDTSSFDRSRVAGQHPCFQYLLCVERHLRLHHFSRHRRRSCHLEEQ